VTYHIRGLGLVSETCKDAHRNCSCQSPDLNAETCLRVKTNKKKGDGADIQGPLSSRSSGEEETASAFRETCAHRQVYSASRSCLREDGREDLKNKRRENTSLPAEKLQE